MAAHSTDPAALDPTEFRHEVASFLTEALSDGSACPAFGAILPPEHHDKARAWQQTLSEAGFGGLHWPTDHGGGGLSTEHSAIWYEECARHRVAPYLNLQGIVLAGEAIIRSGTDDQKQRFLPATQRGEILWCQLFSEPGAGSDLAGLASSAVEQADGGYLLNGQKVWSSNAQFAEFGILLARTDPEAPRHQGISFFLLDMNLPGIEVRPIKQMTGDEEFCEVFFDDVAVPPDALLGQPGQGWKVAMDVLLDERGAFGSAGVISLEQELDALATLGRGREMDAVVTDELSRLVAQGQSLKALLQRLGSAPHAAPAAKLLRTEMSTETNRLAAAMHGASGMLESEQTDRLLYSPGMRIAGGSSEIQRNIIGERVLGLPREPR